MASPEFQQKAKAAGTILTVGTAIGGIVFGTESAVSSYLDHTPLSYILMSSVFRGYWTSSPLARQRFAEIRDDIPPNMIPTFFIPGTHKLDPQAVREARFKLKEWEESYSSLNPTPSPVLIGPHPLPPALPLIPAETKEASLSDLLNFE
jgi:hypothetical protein